MKEFIVEQLSLSTAEEEANYFTGAEPAAQFGPDPSAIMPPGMYRVIEGQLFRIVQGVPVALPGVTAQPPPRRG